MPAWGISIQVTNVRGHRTGASRQFLGIAVAAAIGTWTVALHALVQLNIWALVGGIGFLMIVGAGIVRAARI